MSELKRIRANAKWVAENYGKHSGIEPFAHTAESIAYLDGFLERQAATVTASEASVNKFVSLLGAYLGECIIANYGGHWQKSADGLAICIQTPSDAHWLLPFQKVYKRIANGSEDSLGLYFSEFIPQVLGRTNE